MPRPTLPGGNGGITATLQATGNNGGLTINSSGSGTVTVAPTGGSQPIGIFHPNWA